MKIMYRLSGEFAGLIEKQFTRWIESDLKIDYAGT